MNRKTWRWITLLAIILVLALITLVFNNSIKSSGATGTDTNAGTASPLSIPKSPALALFPTQPSVREPLVEAIDVLGPGKLWIVDGYGMFFSSDWGSNWRYTDPPGHGNPVVDFRSAFFLNSHDGWLIVTSIKRAVVVRTSNGGKSWTSVPLPKVPPWGGGGGTSLSFANPNDGFIALRRNLPTVEGFTTVLSSSDGGSKWSIVDPTAPVGQIRFNSSAIGWGLNPHGTGLFVTNDGGKSWKEVPLPSVKGSSTQWKSLTLPTFFGDTGVLLAQPVLGDALVEITHNDGKTWKSLATPFQAQPAVIPKLRVPICKTCVSIGKEPFSAVSSSTFVYLKDGTLYRTSNGGQSWTSRKTSPASIAIGYLENQGVLGPLQFSSPGSGWAVTGSDGLLLTRDGGKSFSSVMPPCYNVFKEQSCASMGLEASP